MRHLDKLKHKTPCFKKGVKSAHTHNEVSDGAMEDGAIVVAPGAELDEVLTGLGDHVAVQLNVERPLVGHHANVALLLHSLVAQHVLINQRYKFTMKQSASMDNARGIKQQQTEGEITHM